ncbi:arginine--tRNA ligase [Coxiella endosymbiont of Amblyomma sculptum]|uniref:arginine--tRNA ligase n=1 Tax=Coxiella endosymbiont of Amblyomma sculptum TaxID=2487929 RepID=UPI00132EDC4B|nr:arginine--tRNA ligase [Coxiella endosymbiont of Amblyomma sculptum]QHG92687.1 arginine--tRNA ligase [Coxiella endosymbiont of Amblyomma sculptum]
MKKNLEVLLNQTIKNLKEKGTLNSNLFPLFKVTQSQNPKYGDFTTNLALVIKKTVGIGSRVLAEEIVNAFPSSPYVSKVEIAGPGFINFYITASSYQNIIPVILAAGSRYIGSQIGLGKSIHIEYVSANPTGPLHVGHGRSAAYGACVSNLLKIVGYRVHQEYYINDSGRQMEILALSVWIRYLQQYKETLTFPQNAYRGQYIVDIARNLRSRYGNLFFYSQKTIYNQLSILGISGNFDDLSTWMQVQKDLLGKKNCSILLNTALSHILEDIRDDLKEFGIVYDEWFPESRLIEKDLIREILDLLYQQGHVYEKNGARWFRSTGLGDTKDRVLVRRNGVPTYFASDIAYHFYKFNQKYDVVVDIFGSDHHGYVPRLCSFLRTLRESANLQTLLVQFVVFYRKGKKISMSTRSGEFITLRELRREVGNDAARFFYIMYKPDQHLEFDLSLAVSRSNKNPVYYIQYAHARICRIFQKLDESLKEWNPVEGMRNLSLLSNSYEKALLITLSCYEEIIHTAVVQYAPHLLAHYLQNLANQFHAYYNAERFLVEDDKLRNARLNIISAVRQIIANGLTLLGVSAPEKM